MIVIIIYLLTLPCGALEAYFYKKVHAFGQSLMLTSICDCKLSLLPYLLRLVAASLRCVFVYSGNWNDSSANNRGNNGNYWSSTANNTNNAYNLNFNSDNVNPGTNNNNKNNGNSVRCVAPTE